MPLFMLFLLAIEREANAQKLVIRLNSGIESIEPLTTVQKIYFSTNELIVDLKTGPDDTYQLSDVRKIYFDAAVSVDDNTLPESQKLRVWPNPAGNSIIIEGIPVQEGSISIYSMEGRQVMTRVISTGNESIDISGLRQGLYLVTIPGYTTKFIKR